MTQPRIDYSLGKYLSAFDSAQEKMRRDNVIERIRAKDYTLWKPWPDEIVNRLGWLDAPSFYLGKINSIYSSLKPAIEKADDVVLLGMGGSSLGAEVFYKIFGRKTGYPALHVIDTTDSAFISGISRNLNLEKTFFLVSSKSGKTLEITSLLNYFYNIVFQKFGHEAGNRFIFITDEGTPPIKTAENISAYHIFLNNPDIGGRYSALSLPGIVPAALIGVDVETLLRKVASNQEALMSSGASLGVALGVLATKGRDKLTLLLPPHWMAFGDWLEQLIAESTGKEGKGILPVLNEPFDGKVAYGQDRVFVVFRKGLEVNPDELKSLIQAGHPVIEIEVHKDDDLGAQMFIWETATAVAAHFMGVNPFDQPDVEATKKHTRAVIANLDRRGKLTDEKPALSFGQGEIFGNIHGATPADAIRNFLKQAQAGDYICLQNYLSPAAEIDETVGLLRRAISKKSGLPVTHGYGPRYLHSTGQLHKGDSGNGLFIQLTQDDPSDIAIPDALGQEKSSLTFGALKAAQAKGDRQALQEAGRRIIRIHFKSNLSAALKAITEMF